MKYEIRKIGLMGYTTGRMMRAQAVRTPFRKLGRMRAFHLALRTIPQFGRDTKSIEYQATGFANDAPYILP